LRSIGVHRWRITLIRISLASPPHRRRKGVRRAAPGEGIRWLVSRSQEQDFIPSVRQLYTSICPGSVFFQIRYEWIGILHLIIGLESIGRMEDDRLVGNHKHLAGCEPHPLGKSEHPFSSMGCPGIPELITVEENGEAPRIIKLDPFPRRLPGGGVGQRLADQEAARREGGRQGRHRLRLEVRKEGEIGSRSGKFHSRGRDEQGSQDHQDQG
jgi:hypothetical protein